MNVHYAIRRVEESQIWGIGCLATRVPLSREKLTFFFPPVKPFTDLKQEQGEMIIENWPYDFGAVKEKGIWSTSRGHPTFSKNLSKNLSKILKMC